MFDVDEIEDVIEVDGAEQKHGEFPAPGNRANRLPNVRSLAPMSSAKATATRRKSLNEGSRGKSSSSTQLESLLSLSNSNRPKSVQISSSNSWQPSTSNLPAIPAKEKNLNNTQPIQTIKKEMVPAQRDITINPCFYFSDLQPTPQEARILLKYDETIRIECKKSVIFSKNAVKNVHAADCSDSFFMIQLRIQSQSGNFRITTPQHSYKTHSLILQNKQDYEKIQSYLHQKVEFIADIDSYFNEYKSFVKTWMRQNQTGNRDKNAQHKDNYESTPQKRPKPSRSNEVTIDDDGDSNSKDDADSTDDKYEQTPKKKQRHNNNINNQKRGNGQHNKPKIENISQTIQLVDDAGSSKKNNSNKQKSKLINRSMAHESGNQEIGVDDFEETQNYQKSSTYGKSTMQKSLIVSDDSKPSSSSKSNLSKKEINYETYIDDEPVEESTTPPLPPHPPKRRRSDSKGKMKKDEILFYYPKKKRGAIAISHGDLIRCKERDFLNDNIIDFYLRYLFEDKFKNKEGIQELKKRFYLFSCFFFERLNGTSSSRRRSKGGENEEANAYLRVKTWTKNVSNLFKKVLIVPINQMSHWSVIVVVFFEKAIENRIEQEIKKNDIPGKIKVEDDDNSVVIDNESNTILGYIFSLDSLGSHDANSISKKLRSYLNHEFINKLDKLAESISADVKDEETGSHDSQSTETQEDTKVSNDNDDDDIAIVSQLDIGNENHDQSSPSKNLPVPSKIFTRQTLPLIELSPPQQSNGVDCGIYLLVYIEHLLENSLNDGSGWNSHDPKILESWIEKMFNDEREQPKKEEFRFKRKMLEQLIESLRRPGEKLKDMPEIHQIDEECKMDSDPSIQNAVIEMQPSIITQCIEPVTDPSQGTDKSVMIIESQSVDFVRDDDKANNSGPNESQEPENGTEETKAKKESEDDNVEKETDDNSGKNT